jgi:hypothetical protein
MFDSTTASVNYRLNSSGGTSSWSHYSPVVTDYIPISPTDTIKVISDNA